MNARKGLAGAAALAASIALLAFAPAAPAAPSWHSGPVERSYIQNCISYSFPAPIIEEGAWTWTSQFFDPANPPDVNPNATPDANEIFYVSVVAGAVGNACAGQRVHFELLGTPGGGMATAIVPGYPVFCYAINWNNSPTTVQQEPTWPAGACPHLPQPAVFNPGNGVSFDAQTNPANPADTDPWPLPQGQGWEIQVPVTSSLVRNGGSCPGDNDCNTFDSLIIDGNSSPRLFPRFGLFVDSATAGGGSGSPGDGGADSGAPPLKALPTPPRPATPAAPAATTPKCKKGQKLVKGKCAKKKRKKKKK
jgi:hypothetical protein